MSVKRIIGNIKALDLASAQAFYGDFLAMDLVMDHGWIKTFASQEMMHPQISIASEGEIIQMYPIFQSRSTMWMNFMKKPKN